jgi:competence ComEA-like helix-hairpin-helix protein
MLAVRRFISRGSVHEGGRNDARLMSPMTSTARPHKMAGLSPLHSLLVKFGLLALVAGFVLWFGWPAEDPVGPDLAGPIQALSPSPGPTAHSCASLPPHHSRPAAPLPSRSKLDLNQATPEELQQLPGIGEVLAKRMITRRETTGGFRTVDDLLTVKGIGHKRLKQLRPLLTVGPVQERGRPRLAPVAPKDRL